MCEEKGVIGRSFYNELAHIVYLADGTPQNMQTMAFFFSLRQNCERDAVDDERSKVMGVYSSSAN